MIIKPKPFVRFTDKSVFIDKELCVHFLAAPIKHHNERWDVDMYYIPFHDIDNDISYNITLYSSLASQFQALVNTGFIRFNTPYRFKILKELNGNKFNWAFDVEPAERNRENHTP